MEALLCRGCAHYGHKLQLSNYYDDINRSMVSAGRAHAVKTSNNYTVIAGWNTWSRMPIQWPRRIS